MPVTSGINRCTTLQQNFRNALPTFLGGDVECCTTARPTLFDVYIVFDKPLDHMPSVSQPEFNYTGLGIYFELLRNWICQFVDNL